MSQQKPNRYELPITSMVGAMIVVLVFVTAYIGLRAFTRDNPDTKVETVEYSSWVKAGRADGKLAVMVPVMPAGWRATSASYDTGTEPHWHLGVLTSSQKYVGLEESLDSIDSVVQRFVDPDATAGPKVRVAGQTWQSWTDRGGDYALVRSAKAPSGSVPETVLVVGSAGAKEIQAFAASLSAG